METVHELAGLDSLILYMRALLPRPACIARLNISSKPSAVRANNCIRAFTSSSPLLKFQLTLKQQDDTAKTSSLTDRKGEPFSRAALESLLRRRLFYTPAFEIYQGQQDVETRGLYDYGPPGCALQTNIVDLFRKHFILAEDMLEVDCTSLTPYQVLKTSGHVAKFSDWMCRDKKTEEILRADHVVREVLEGRIRAHKLKKGEPVEEVEEVEDVGPAKGGKPKEKIRSKITRPMEIDDKTARLYEELLAQVQCLRASCVSYHARQQLTCFSLARQLRWPATRPANNNPFNQKPDHWQLPLNTHPLQSHVHSHPRPP